MSRTNGIRKVPRLYDLGNRVLKNEGGFVGHGIYYGTLCVVT